ncbi:MAG: type II CAAX endopeptidase family protein [Cyclobacteriaceae bacterium]
MVGILIALLLSWAALYFIEKRSILALGFTPVVKRLVQFFAGFIITALLCLTNELLEVYLRSATVNLSASFSFQMLMSRLWWDFRSVLTEELIFRGAILYILIARIGQKKAILISAVAFGVYHWFSYGLFGNLVPMIVIFTGTGLMGYAWALAFAKTRSIFLPTGLHLGWNFTLNTVFSKGPLEGGMLWVNGTHKISDWYSLIELWVIPLILLLILIYAFRVLPENTYHTEDRPDTKR